MSEKTKKLTTCALMAALMAVCSQIAIPLPGGVPLTLSLVGVYLTGIFLEPGWALASQCVYLALGLCGLPVYAGFASGAGVLFGLTGGFLFIFPVMAWVTSLSCRRFRGIIPLALGLLLSLFLCYGAGSVWYMALGKVGLRETLVSCVLPFVPLDVCKAVFALVLAQRMKKPLALGEF